MKKITLALSAICLLFTLNHSANALVSSPSTLNPGTNVAKLAEQAPVHWVSVAQIENSLTGRPPMAVGFDIDDTVLFSSPGFWRGKKTYSPDSDDYLKNPAFWEKMNNGWDEFSIPKEVARQLIDMHVRRGDSIYFVTGRSQTKTETVSKTLADNFHIPAANMNPVIFAGDKPEQIRKYSGCRRRTCVSSTAIRITILPRLVIVVSAVFASCARLTPPTNRCRRQERLARKSLSTRSTKNQESVRLSFFA